MKLELTDRQAEALLTALRTFDDSYAGYSSSDEDILARTKADLRICERIANNLLTQWQEEEDRKSARQAVRDNAQV
jgi:hypothetical protein